MKITIALLLLACANAGQLACADEAGNRALWVHEASATNLIVKVVPDMNRYTPRDPVMIFVSLRNAGTTSVMCTMSDPLSDFTFDLKDDRGDSVPMTRWMEQGLRRIRDGMISISGRPLHPGEILEYVVRLNAAFDLSRPGQYTLEIAKPMITGESTVRRSTNRLRSNLATFEMDMAWEQVEWTEQVKPDKRPAPPYLLPKRKKELQLR